MRISIVVRAKNEEQHLPRLFRGLGLQDVEPHECILVDSGSTDSTVALARNQGWKVVSVPPESFTFGRSLNIGFAAATGDVVVILSAHTYPVRTDFLRELTSELSDLENTFVYGRQVGDKRTKFSERVIMSQWFPAESVVEQGHAFSNNACAAVPRKLWEALRYDESLSGLEDIDFARRVLNKGGSVAYREKAKIVHVHEESARGTHNRYRREAYAYAQIFPHERMSLARAARLLTNNIFRDLRLAHEAKVLTGNLLSIMVFRIAQFTGSWRGLRQGRDIESALWRTFYHPSVVPFAIDEWATPESNAIRYEGSHD